MKSAALAAGATRWIAIETGRGTTETEIVILLTQACVYRADDDVFLFQQRQTLERARSDQK